MNSKENILLKDHTTMRLGGKARYFITISTPEELQELFSTPQFKNLPIFVLGGGSNVIAPDDGFAGAILHITIPGFEIINDDEFTTLVKIGAGESWDETVAKAVEHGLSGIECLSAIPGTVGAAPVQNIGAYGQELADTFVSLEAYDTHTNSFVTLDKQSCGFGYRHSIFRGEQQGRYIITSVTLQLQKTVLQPPFYQALQNYLETNNIIDYSPASLRQAVIAIRADKLPDPAQKPNAGSFFKNALITQATFHELAQHYPDMPAYPAEGEMVKIPTGWLIEQCGFKGRLLHGIRIHDKNALVLINEATTSTHDLITTRDIIIQAVQDRFGIAIEQEPLVVGV